MSSGTQYMLQKNPCTRLPLLTFGILIAINRVGVRNIVWPKDVHVKKFRLETDGWGWGWQATLRRDDDGLTMLDLYCSAVRCDTSPVSSDLLQLLQSTGAIGALRRGAR